MNKLLFVGSLFPDEVIAGDLSFLSVGQESFLYSYLDDNKLIVSTTFAPAGLTLIARPRLDGVYYLLDSYLFSFDVTVPKPPEIAPAPPASPIPTGVDPNSSMRTSLSGFLLLLGSIILFLNQ